MDNAHDKLFKLIYSRPEQAAAYFEQFLPAPIAARLELAALKLVPGSFVDDALKDRHTDLLYQVPLRRAGAPAGGRADEEEVALVYLLFEHQSTADPLMAYRLLRYMVRIWERWLKLQPRRGPGQRLPPIIPLVLYHGARAWRPSTAFEALVADPEGVFKPFTPHFRFALNDLGAVPDVQLERAPDRVSQLALLLFKHGRDPDLLSQLKASAALLRTAQALQLRWSSAKKIHGSRLASTPISAPRDLEWRPAVLRSRGADFGALAGRR